MWAIIIVFVFVILSFNQYPMNWIGNLRDNLREDPWSSSHNIPWFKSLNLQLYVVRKSHYKVKGVETLSKIGYYTK